MFTMEDRKLVRGLIVEEQQLGMTGHLKLGWTTKESEKTSYVFVAPVIEGMTSPNRSENRQLKTSGGQRTVQSQI